jgi:hypothetical protein
MTCTGYVKNPIIGAKTSGTGLTKNIWENRLKTI